MTEGHTAGALGLAAHFDALVDQALDEREAAYGVPVFAHHHLRRLRVSSVAEAYLNGGVYPPERIDGVVARAVDVKLQLYITGEILPAMVNRYYYERVNREPEEASMASVKLVALSLHQDMITKSRILWDRIMGWVYFIETGRQDIPRTGRRSAKREFFRMCSVTPCWKWMTAYEPTISDFDNRLRTPEVHKRSTLRALLLRGETLESVTNEVLSLMGHAMNQIWDNVQSIVGGGGVVSLGKAHMLFGDQGNDNLTENAFDVWGWQPSDE